MQRIGSLTALAVVWAGCGKVDSPNVDAAEDDDPDAATCAASPSGLAGRWRGDDDAADQTGAYPGTPLGDLGYTAGRHGRAFLFDGTDDLVAIDDGDALWPVGSFSIEAWVRTTRSGPIVQKYECGGVCQVGSGSYWSLGIADTGNPAFTYRVEPVDAFFTATATLDDVADGAWHHLVGVRDVTAREVRIYVDGSLAGSSAITEDALGPLTNVDGQTDPVTIGASAIAGQAGYEGFFAGAVDDVAYYRSAATADEIAALHAARDGACP
jgi:hypothetical protein